MKTINVILYLNLTLYLFLFISCNENKSKRCKTEFKEQYQDLKTLNKTRQLDSLYLIFGAGFDLKKCKIYKNHEIYKELLLNTVEQTGMANQICLGDKRTIKDVNIEIFECNFSINHKEDYPIALFDYDKTKNELMITYQNKPHMYY